MKKVTSYRYLQKNFLNFSSKLFWCHHFSGEVGISGSEEDQIERYILTKFPEAKFTPAGKYGLQVEFGVTKTERVIDQIIIENSEEDSDNESSDSESSDEEEDVSDFTTSSED